MRTTTGRPRGTLRLDPAATHLSALVTPATPGPPEDRGVQRECFVRRDAALGLDQTAEKREAGAWAVKMVAGAVSTGKWRAVRLESARALEPVGALGKRRA